MNLCALLAHSLGTPLAFIPGEIFFVGCDEPDMPKGVFQRAHLVIVAFGRTGYLLKSGERDEQSIESGFTQFVREP